MIEEEAQIISKNIKQICVGKEEWSVQLIAIPRKAEAEPCDEFAAAFGFKNINENE